jgi:hypothetical protein
MKLAKTQYITSTQNADIQYHYVREKFQEIWENQTYKVHKGLDLLSGCQNHLAVTTVNHQLLKA